MIFEDKQNEPEDILKDVEPPAPPAGSSVPGAPTSGGRPVIRAVEPGQQKAMPPVSPKRGGGLGKILGILLVVLVVVAAGGAAAWYFLILPSMAPLPEAPTLEEEPAATEQVEEEPPVAEETEEEPLIEEEEEAVQEEEAVEPEEETTEEEEGEVMPQVDTDGDGLSDTDEAALGTNANVADTDGDGLTDREEVQVWKTNPLNPDTDLDGYEDKAEIDNGYNPNGPGKLPSFPPAT